VSTGASLLLAALMLAGNAFFVGAEFAVMSARRSQIEPRAHGSADGGTGSGRARTTLWALEHVSVMLACAQFGITVCTLALGALAEPAVEHLLAPGLRALGLPRDVYTPIALLVALLLVSYLHVVLGELVPKNLALAGPERAVLLLAPPVVWLARMLRPIVFVLNGLANLGVRLLGKQPRDEVSSTFTIEEIAPILAESQREGLLADEQGLVSGALDFGGRTASDVMVPREQLVLLSAEATPEQVEQAVTRTGFSRFPVQRDGRIVGYLHMKDVLDLDDEESVHRPVPARRIRAFDPVAADDDIETVLRSMQQLGIHLGRVDDAVGELVGVVFLEDVLEELVGEVTDATQRDRAG
jgi:CBS domain containing-hemolysin-like protein